MKTLLFRTAATLFVYLIFRFPKLSSSKRIKKNIFKTFSKLAPEYDEWTVKTGVRYETALEVLLEDLKRHKFAPRNMLDLATGTAKGAIALARQFPNVPIGATDFVPEMIEIAKKKAQAENLNNVHFKVADSEQTGEPDNSYDFVMTMNAPVYFNEMIRILRPQGILAFVFSTPYPRFIKKIVTRRIQKFPFTHVHFVPAPQGFGVWGILHKEARQEEETHILKV